MLVEFVVFAHVTKPAGRLVWNCCNRCVALVNGTVLGRPHQKDNGPFRWWSNVRQSLSSSVASQRTMLVSNKALLSLRSDDGDESGQRSTNATATGMNLTVCNNFLFALNYSTNFCFIVVIVVVMVAGRIVVGLYSTGE